MESQHDLHSESSINASDRLLDEANERAITYLRNELKREPSPEEVTRRASLEIEKILRGDYKPAQKPE